MNVSDKDLEHLQDMRNPMCEWGCDDPDCETCTATDEDEDDGSFLKMRKNDAGEVVIENMTPDEIASFKLDESEIDSYRRPYFWERSSFYTIGIWIVVAGIITLIIKNLL